MLTDRNAKHDALIEAGLTSGAGVSACLPRPNKADAFALKPWSISGAQKGIKMGELGVPSTLMTAPVEYPSFQIGI